MALVKCPDCGKMVSSRIAMCPDCGCPSEFFEGANEKQVGTESQVEYKIFDFKQCTIKYPQNAEKFAGLYGDYLKIGFEKYKLLRVIYRELGDADSVAKKLGNEAQKIIDEQIGIVLSNLYENGISMSMAQFKQKYADKYPLSYEVFLDSFFEEYNNILGKQSQMRHNREVSYANRMRWSGGGFGMAGAIKGAVQAGVLNVGSSMISGLGNAVIESVNEGSIERRKQRLFENQSIMNETCEGMIICMNGLFAAFTDELYVSGKLGSKIEIDFDSANVKYEAMVKYEKDNQKIFATVIECLGLYPASRTFYETVEMELETCPDWKAFKNYWHLDFLYKGTETAYLKTTAKMDGKSGTLKLYQDVLVFDGDNQSHSKKIPIGSIKEIDENPDDFLISLKGKFLGIVFRTPMDSIWVNTLNKALRGNYEKIDLETIDAALITKEEEIKEKSEKAKEYILANYTVEQKRESIMYFYKQTGVELSEAKRIVDSLFPTEKVNRYPGTEDLDNGLFRGDRVVLYCGGETADCYTILTTKELIDIDIKKKKEIVYDVYKISRMKSGFLGLVLSFKYAGSFVEKSVSAQGVGANTFIDKINNMQKGIFD